jgi:adenosylmethionine-8-amino-7-oxononanoate aminotransferase
MSEMNQWSAGEQKKKVIETHHYFVKYEDKETIDINAGNFSYVLGYSDEDVKSSMSNIDVAFLRGNSGESSIHNDALINYICNKGNWSGLAWAVSGSDAVEAAIAMNDFYWQCLGQHKPKIISFTPGYHGTTMLAKHLRGEYLYLNRAELIDAPVWRSVFDREQQEQLALQSIRNKLQQSDVGCIIMETLPWVGCISPYSQNWWESIRKLCDEYQILFVLDDVAICYGKLGHMFGWQEYNVQPDICAIGKALTAGYSPLGAAVCNKKVYDVLQYKSWDHGHTWSPNMQGVAAAITASVKIESLLHRVPVINSKLESIGDKLGLTYRSAGLFIAYDTNQFYSLADLHSVGLTATMAGENCIKVVAPLIADDHYFDSIERSFSTLLARK